MYVGDTADERIRRSRAADARFKATGEVAYIPVVSSQPTPPDPTALLTAPPVHQFYIRWADRGPLWNFHGLWENRITAMSEAAIWSHDVRPVMARLTTPTLMVHSDRAASGPQIPRDLFALIPAARKELVWLGSENQLQFYEDPLTIDQVVPHLVRFFPAAPTSVPRSDGQMRLLSSHWQSPECEADAVPPDRRYRGRPASYAGSAVPPTGRRRRTPRRSFGLRSAVRQCPSPAWRPDRARPAAADNRVLPCSRSRSGIRRRPAALRPP
jgi:hypothetical protein